MSDSAQQEKEIINHKELVPFEHYLDTYRNTDPLMMSERTGFPYHSDDAADARKGWFDITYLHRPYEVTWPDFQVRCCDGLQEYSPLEETNQSKILVIRFLLEGAAVKGSGKYLTYREVPWGEVYYRQFSGRCLSRLAFTYGNRLSDYKLRMQRMGAYPVAQSDAGFEYEIFPDFKVQFLLWEGDDEFPPSAQILFSDNFTAAFHPEDLVVVSEIMIGALKRVTVSQ